MTMQAYMASISFSDWVLGQILDALDDSEHADNTIVVLWSDHGYHIGEKEKLHKQTLWSQACHVPFVIRLPKGTNEATRCAAPVSLLDIYPTLNELCDLTQAVPQSLDGHSLVPLIKDSETEWPHVAVSSHGPSNVAVSDARYRYIRYADGSDELYDHEADPREFTNLAGLPKAERVKQRLAKSLPDNVIDEVKGSRNAGSRNEPGLVASSTTVLSDAESNRPNIVFFLSDDQGYADAGFNGGTDIKTPNLDRLAENGTILTSLYAQPVCSPTRAALMTGRYPTNTGVYQVMNAKNTWRLKPDERTLAKALHDAGYETAICGKWHLGHEPGNRPTDQGFDHQYGFMSGAIDSFKLTSGRGDGEPGRDWYRNDQRCDDQGYATELIADEACRIIETKDPARPLFLYVPFGAVHTPHQAPDRYTAAYRGLPRPRKNLAAMTTAMDEAVERIVNALIEKGIRDNTLIIFCSDNGGVSWGASASNAPLRGGKADIYEGGVRVCAFANWPGKIPAGVKNDQPMHVIDWYPTLIKLAGESIDQPLAIDGKDIWTVLTEDAQSPHEEILIVGSVGGQRAIRMGDWKLLINPWDREKEGKGRGSSGRVELYDLSHDIGETTNLVDQHPDRAKQMRARLEDQLTTPVNPAGFYSLRELQALKTETLK
jgi:arylsulfatase A-like enzyme